MGQGCLDVAILHDDTRELAALEGGESIVAVWESIVAIEESLNRLGHRSRRLCIESRLSKLIESLDSHPPDVVFHLAETVRGDSAGEARVTALLDLLCLAHTSESPEALLRSRDKIRLKALFAEHGIATPAYAVAETGLLPERLPDPPWIAKPSLEDGSTGIGGDALCEKREQLAVRVKSLYDVFKQPILIEAYVDGPEFHVGFVGDDCLPLVELDFSGLRDSPAIAGYESKWRYDSPEFKGLHFTCPARLAPNRAERLREIGRAVRRAVGLERYGRLDIRADRADRFYVLDVNPNPDLSPIATMPTMASAAGLGFDGLVSRLLELALRGRPKRAAEL